MSDKLTNERIGSSDVNILDYSMPVSNEFNLLSPNINQNDYHPASIKLYSIADRLAKARNYHIENQPFDYSNDNKNNFIKAVAKKLFNRDWSPEPLSEKQLKNQESMIASKLFGIEKPNHRIEFFNDSINSWFFHQEIVDSKSVFHSVTYHYEVRPSEIVKIYFDKKNDKDKKKSKDKDINRDNNIVCETINGTEEFDNFIKATDMYYELVMKNIYNQAPTSGKKVQ